MDEILAVDPLVGFYLVGLVLIVAWLMAMNAERSAKRREKPTLTAPTTTTVYGLGKHKRRSRLERWLRRTR